MSRNCQKSIKIRDLDKYRDMDWRFRVTMRHMCHSPLVCALAITHSVIPPTINYTTPDPACDLDYVPNTAREGKIRACLNNSLGFGGHNATLCFKAV